MNNKRSLVKVDSSIVSKGDKLLSLTTKTLAPYYSELRDWWNNLEETWKYDLLKLLSKKGKYTGEQGEILYVPKNHELEKFIFTNKLDISEGKRNLDPLKRFQNLIYLKGSNQKQLTDIKGLEKLTSLKKIFLRSSRMSDLEPLRKLVNVESLDLYNSDIKNLEPLTNLHKLKYLSIAYCPFIEDISPLATLNNLIRLNCGSISNVYSKTFDFTPLGNLLNLISLDCGYILLESIEFLDKLTKLECLNLGFVGIGRGSLRDVFQILRELDYSSNIQADLEPVRNMISLKRLLINNTNITNIEALFNLPNLEFVNVDSTYIPESQIKFLSKINPKCTIVIEDRAHENGTYKYYKNSEIYLKDKSNKEKKLK